MEEVLGEGDKVQNRAGHRLEEFALAKFLPEGAPTWMPFEGWLFSKLEGK